MENLDEILQRKMKEGREYRRIDVHNITVRSDEENEMVVEGYATTFNQPYELYNWGDYIVNEQIDARAFEDCDMSDVIMQYDHRGRVFARCSNKTLELATDSHGLHIRAKLGGTTIGRQLYEEIKGGYTDKMSFGFIVGKDERVVEEDHEKNVTTVLRTITKISKLYDVSAVSLPANDATEISARAFSEGVIAEARAERSAAIERANRIKKLKLILEVSK